MNTEKPVEVEDERVGKHFEHSRYGSTHYCEKAVMFNGHKFLTLVKVDNVAGQKVFEVRSIISWCVNDDADFYMNFMEM